MGASAPINGMFLQHFSFPNILYRTASFFLMRHDDFFE
jgi:hypothetical protein